ncbi:uncharacterized protein LY89DRAFT_760959 [Mollisia scopiformis]|uniref:Uncharacterized protein n=1 Tax=Mollisia scopiformis TaxID=149040 RepID=A0A132BE64_MOLSC|nr:uncharacterized protein LY89DRAFT_760959 [Mollisia scopiformis]KUJ10134.1 hypothetical protein LY89DRAFT_760959 [Mollisia scopiformis]
MPPSTPRRPRAPTPAAQPRDQWQLPPFFLGMVVAAFLFIAGMSVKPAVGECLVTRSTVRVNPLDVQEHMRYHKACGLPEMKAGEFRCEGGVFMGENPVVESLNIKCPLTLTGVRNGKEYTLDLFDWTPTSTRHLVKREPDLQAPIEETKGKGIDVTYPDFIVRWRQGEEDDTTRFTLNRGHMFPHLSGKYMEAYKDTIRDLPHYFPLSDLQMSLVSWSEINELETSRYHLRLALQSTKPGKVTKRFHARLQYQCVKEQPRLTLLPPNGTAFFGMPGEFEPVFLEVVPHFGANGTMIGHSRPGCRQGAPCVWSWGHAARKDFESGESEFQVLVNLHSNMGHDEL